MAAAESGAQVQGVCPDGWHVASKAEWDFLINGCTDEDEPGTALKEASFWDPSATNIGANTLGFNMAGAGYIWQTEDPAAEPLSANTVIEAGMNTYFWTSTAPKEGDIRNVIKSCLFFAGVLFSCRTPAKILLPVMTPGVVRMILCQCLRG